MTQAIEQGGVAQPAPTRVARIYPAPRALVFEAWSSARHVRNWFHPIGYGAPAARVEMRVGGAFEVCMRAPDGSEHWTRGSFVELVPDERLVLDLYAVDADGKPLFRAFTEVRFTDDAGGGTRMEVVQSYSFERPEQAAPMVAGAPEGWRQTLDKLGTEIAAMLAGAA